MSLLVTTMVVTDLWVAVVIVVASVVDATIGADVDLDYDSGVSSQNLRENHLFGLTMVPNNWFSAPTMLSPKLSVTSLLTVTVLSMLVNFGPT